MDSPKNMLPSRMPYKPPMSVPLVDLYRVRDTEIMKRAVGGVHVCCDPGASLGLVAIGMGAVTHDLREGSIILQSPAALTDGFFQRSADVYFVGSQRQPGIGRPP